MLVLTNTILQRLLVQAIDHAVAGPFSGCFDGLFLGLSVAPTTTLGPNNTLADIHEATYDGYVRQAITWRTPYVESAGNVGMQTVSTFWSPTDAVVGNVIVGMFLADAVTAGNLVGSERFAVPQNLAGPLNAFSLTVLLQLAATLGYGSTTIIN